MAERFTIEYTKGDYETISEKRPTYHIIAEAALKRLPVPNGGVILDIGSGTGNSTIDIAQNNPNFEKMICLEPSPAIEVASYKFGGTKPTGLTPQVENHVERRKSQTKPFREKVHLIRAKTPGIPLKDKSVDVVYGIETVHWWQFVTQESDPDHKLLSDSAAEVARVMKPNARFVFSTNGHVLDYEDSILNQIHFTKHPLWKVFNRKFDEYAQDVHGVDTVKRQPDTLAQSLSVSTVRDTLSRNELKLVPTDAGEYYELTLIPTSIEYIRDSIEKGSRMSCFTNNRLSSIPESEKNKIVQEILAEIKYDDTLNQIRYFETIAIFLAEKT